MSDTPKCPDLLMPEGASEGSLLEQFNLAWPEVPVRVCMGTRESGFVFHHSTMGEFPHDPEILEALEEIYMATLGQMQFATPISFHEGHGADDCSHGQRAVSLESADPEIREQILAALSLDEPLTGCDGSAGEETAE